MKFTQGREADAIYARPCGARSGATTGDQTTGSLPSERSPFDGGQRPS